MTCAVCGRDYKHQDRATYFCRRSGCPATTPTVLPPVGVHTTIWYDEGGKKIYVALHVGREEDKTAIHTAGGTTLSEAVAGAVRVMLLDYHTAEFVAKK